MLNVPKTEVEHWFRTDKCFSVPNEEKWLELKELLQIETNEFDKSIMTFEIRDGVFDKANRVYDENGIAPTITCTSAENERYKIYGREGIDMNEPRLVGGIGEINFGKQWRQGNRVYSSEDIEMCLMAQPVGNAGGYSYLYNIENKGERNMWKNNLEKLNYEMEEIRLFDAFAGKGALHKSLKKLGVPVNVVGLSEVEPDAVIAYAAIHIEDFKNLEFNFPSDEEMRELLMNRNIGWDFMKQKSSIPRMKKEKLKLLYKATILTNNLGDISKIDYNNMFDFDLFNLSFPCTDLSGAGKQTGLKNEDGSHTRSGLIKFGLDIVRAKTPKYIMIENVKALIQKKFIGDFYDIVNEIEKIGYKCYYPTKTDKKKGRVPCCLNAKDFGIAQNRERIFVICVRNDIDTIVEMPVGGDQGIRLKHMLEENVEDKYYLSDEIQKRFKTNGKIDVDHNELNVVGSSAPECRTIGQRDMTYGANGIMSTLTATDYKQPKQIVDKLDKGGVTVCEQRSDEGLRFFKDNICGSLRTIDSCGDKRIIEENKTNCIGQVSQNKKSQAGKVYDIEGTSQTLCAGTHGYAMGNIAEPKIITEENFSSSKCEAVKAEDNKLNQIGILDIKGNDQIRRVYSKEGLSPTLSTMQGGNRQPKIASNEHFCENKSYQNKGNIDKDELQSYNDSTYYDTISQNCDFRIRKLTPLECFRLMGFDDGDFYKAKNTGLSDSALYKLAGNSIVCNCLYYIFKNVFKEFEIK